MGLAALSEIRYGFREFLRDFGKKQETNPFNFSRWLCRDVFIRLTHPFHHFMLMHISPDVVLGIAAMTWWQDENYFIIIPCHLAQILVFSHPFWTCALLSFFMGRFSTGRIETRFLSNCTRVKMPNFVFKFFNDGMGIKWWLVSNEIRGVVE